MNCFQHPRHQAVGTCMYCGRGLCPDCASMVEGKLSCRGDCQQEIARERRLIVQSEIAMGQRSAVYETSGESYRGIFAFCAVMGAGFLLFGIFLLLGEALIPGAIFTSMGILFLISGFGMARAGKKFKTLAAEGREESSKP